MEYKFQKGDIVRFKPDDTSPQYSNLILCVLDVKENAIQLKIPYEYDWWNAKYFELDKIYYRKEKLKQLKNEL